MKVVIAFVTQIKIKFEFIATVALLTRAEKN